MGKDIIASIRDRLDATELLTYSEWCDYTHASPDRSIDRARDWAAGRRCVVPEQMTRPSGQRIYECMVDEVYRHGYHGASLRRLAKAAGLTMSTLYHYYPSKEDILLDTMTTTLTDLRACIDEATLDVESPTEQIANMIRAHIGFHIVRAQEAWVADTEFKSLGGDSAVRIAVLRDAYEQLFVDVLSAGTRADEFQLDAPRITAKAILAMCTAVALWFQPNGQLTAHDIADNYIKFTLTGISRPKHGTRDGEES